MDVIALRSALDNDLTQIELALELPITVSGETTDDGLVARIIAAIDGYAARRAQWANQWRAEHVPGAPPAVVPPVPSEVVRKTAPAITAALKKGASLPELSTAAASDLKRAAGSWSWSLAREIVPWIVVFWLVSRGIGRTNRRFSYGT